MSKRRKTQSQCAVEKRSPGKCQTNPYNPKHCQINTHIESLYKNLVLHSSRYGNFIVLWDFNVSIGDS